MSKVNGFNRLIVVLGALLLAVSLGAPAQGIMPGDGEGGIPLPLRSCETDGDTVIIGIGAAVDLGEEVAIPVYVGSDDCIETWRFLFDLPDEVDDVSQVRVEAVGWPYEIDELWIDNDGYLVVERSIGAGCSDPDLEDVFLNLYISTHCWEMEGVNLAVKWGPPGDPRDPDIFLGIDGGCSRDPLEYLEDGSFEINPIVISFDIMEATGLIGEEVLVTVTCDNEYEFRSFRHYIQYDPTVLELAEPVVEPGDRDLDTLFHNAINPGEMYVYGGWWSGCGTNADGPDLYHLRFRVISPIENTQGAVSFWFPGWGLWGVWGMDCWQFLHEFADVSFENGSVTVPRYWASFDIGNAFCANDNVNVCHLPLYLKNNYRIFEFRLPVMYNDDLEDPLEFIGFESANPTDFVGFGQYCQDYGGEGYKYGVLMTQGITEIEPSEEYRYIGDLLFLYTEDSPGTVGYYHPDFIEFGCEGEYSNWVHTWDDVRGETEYGWADPQTHFIRGFVNVREPIVWVRATSAYGSGETNWEQKSHILVRSVVDLNEISFTVPWEPDVFCVTATDELGNTTIIVDEENLEATVTITDIKSDYDYIDYGCLFIENATHEDQTGTLDVIDIVAVETYPSGRLSTYGLWGTITLFAVPVHMQTCDELFMLRKETTLPWRFALQQNYPNPFNASTLIEFTLPEAAHTNVEVFNIMGQRVATLLNEFTEAGPYSILWNGRNDRGSVVASGMYLYRLRSGTHLVSKKMVLMK